MNLKNVAEVPSLVWPIARSRAAGIPRCRTPMDVVTHFEAPFPARTAIAAAALRLGAAVEIEFVAA